MSSRFLVFQFLLLLSWSLGCSTSKEYPAKYKGDRIHFGQGGGFTGGLTYFVLLEDGRLYQRATLDSTFNYRDTWSKSFTQQMFTNYKHLHLDTVNHYEPGDLYYFIQYQSINQPMHRIAWGKPGFKANENTVTFYNLLYKTTKAKS